MKEESTVSCTLSSLLGAATAAVAAAAAAAADCCRAAAATACCSPPPAAPALPLQHGLEALPLLDPPLHNNRVSQHDHQGGLVSTLEFWRELSFSRQHAAHLLPAAAVEASSFFFQNIAEE
jgi:hypothetical protein